jgi:hypothetical protein
METPLQRKLEYTQFSFFERLYRRREKKNEDGKTPETGDAYPGSNMTPTLKTLEQDILTWQQLCLRKFSPLDGGEYQLRVLPVALANGRPWLRYGQHWVGAAQRRPLACPDCTEPTVLAEPGACPLCQALQGDCEHPDAVRLSYLLYCFVLQENGTPVAGDCRFRLHQWWMPQPVFDRFRGLAQRAAVLSFGAARNLAVRCEGSRLTLGLGDEFDLRVPGAVKERVMSAAVSPKRRVNRVDLNYEAIFLSSGQPVQVEALGPDLEPEY